MGVFFPFYSFFPKPLLENIATSNWQKFFHIILASSPSLVAFGCDEKTQPKIMPLPVAFWRSNHIATLFAI
jgi:hypothetical protein